MTYHPRSLTEECAGTGFNIRDRADADVDEELDVDGNDEDLFGNAQFGESDVVPVNEDEDIDIGDMAEDVSEEAKPEPRLRDLVVANQAGGTPDTKNPEPVRLSLRSP